MTLHFKIICAAFQNSKYYGIAMDYVSNGELYDHVELKHGMTETSAQEMFAKIVHGVQHCHSNGIAHRDLKLENILLDQHQEPKVI